MAPLTVSVLQLRLDDVLEVSPGQWDRITAIAFDNSRELVDVQFATGGTRSFGYRSRVTVEMSRILD